jgi:hypothetical protein
MNILQLHHCVGDFDRGGLGRENCFSNWLQAHAAVSNKLRQPGMLADEPITGLRAEQPCARGAASEARPCAPLAADNSTQQQRTQREHHETVLKLTAEPATALCALAFVSFATPAPAGEFRRKDVTAGIVGCGFDTMEQCQAMSSGRGGDCFRDPFLPARDAFAYAPKGVARPAHHAGTH